jgi:hypothetical protein
VVGGFSVFKTMLDESPSVTTESPSGSASSDAATNALSGQEQATAPGGDTAPLETQSQTDSLPDYFNELPTMEELEQNKNERFATALQSLRPKHEELYRTHETLQQQFTPWSSVVERYENPENFQTAFETGRGLFSETGELDPQTQLPIRTTVPNLLKLGQANQADFLQLAEDVMHGVTYQGKPMAVYGLEKLGLNPDHIEQYQQWEREGFSPAAVGYSEEEQAALTSIPDKFKPAFEKAPQEVQRDWLNMPENLRNYHLEREQRDLDSQQAQQRGAQEAQVRFNQEIQSNSQNERMQSFGTSYGQLIKDLEPWQPTGNAVVDGLYRHSIGQLLTNVFDPQMNSDPALPFSVVPLLQQIAPNVDVKTLAAQADEWDKQRDLAVRYEAFNKREQGRYQTEATQARNEANRTLRNLNTKMGALAKEVVKYLTGDKAEQDAAELAAQGQQGRPRVTGTPNGNQPPPQQGYNTDWRANYYR